MGLGSLSGGGVLIAGGGVGCTDCFQNDAESVGAGLLAIPGSILAPPLPATHHLWRGSKLTHYIVLRFGCSRFNRLTLS